MSAATVVKSFHSLQTNEGMKRYTGVRNPFNVLFVIGTIFTVISHKLLNKLAITWIQIFLFFAYVEAFQRKLLCKPIFYNTRVVSRTFTKDGSRFTFKS